MRRCVTAFVALLGICASAAGAGGQHFHLPAGDAAVVLQQLVEETGLPLVFPMRVVRGVRTQAVEGEMTAREALQRALAGTPLEVVPDPWDGALAVRRLPTGAFTPSSPGHRAAEPPGPPGGATELPAIQVAQRRELGLATPALLPPAPDAALYHHVVTREEIEQSGVTTLAEFLTTVPGYSGEGAEALQSTADLTLTGGANVYGGSFLKLRGWDSQHTAVLVNGRALPISPESRGPDLSRIPLAAVERIEVLPFAGSALYGDGAVGGAMNIVLRRDFAGQSVSLQLGDSTRGAGGEAFLTWVDGFASPEGRTRGTLIGDFQARGALRLGERDFLARAVERLPPDELLRNASNAPAAGRRTLLQSLLTGYPAVFASAENGADLGLPGRPGALFAVVPEGRNAAALTRGAFVETDPRALRERRQARVVLRRPTRTFNLDLQLEHALKPDRLELYGELGYSRASESFRAPDQIEPLALGRLDPRNPFRADLANNFVGRDVTLYFDPVDLPDALFRQTRDSVRMVAGVRGTPRPRWQWSLEGWADFSRVRTRIDAYGTALNELLRRWTPERSDDFAGIYDPLADHRGAPLPAAARERYLAQRAAFDFHSRMFGAEARVRGRLAELPAGTLRASAGLEFEASRRITRQSTTASRELYAFMEALPAYALLTAPTENIERGERIGTIAEALVPLWRPGMKPLPLHAAELNLASRAARTDGGHAAVSSLAAVKIAPSRAWALRATWSQGSAAPAGALVHGPVITTTTTASVVDPLRGGVRELYPVRVVQGASQTLRPESSRAQVIGLLLTPPSAPGFFLSLDAWSIDMRDHLRAPTFQELLTYADYFPRRVTRALPLGWEIALGWPGPVTEIDARPLQVTRLESAGIDLAFRYRLPPWRAGTFTLSGQLETVRRYREQFLPQTAAVDKVNVIADATAEGLMESAVVSPRGRASLAWQRAAWFGSITAGYTPRYQTETTRPTPALPNATGVDGDWIGSSLRWDLQLGYAIPRETRFARSWFSATTWTLGVRNVFDRSPAPRADGTSFYSRLEDPRMRFIYGRVQWRR